jgi:alkylation response protein AidB-like acyl-CoA dehydrogenase
MVFPFRSVEDFRVELTEEHELFRKSVRDFVESKVMPRWREIEESNRIPEDLVKEMVALGLTGVGIPEEYGGQGGGVLMTVVMTEELSRASTALSVKVGVRDLFVIPVLRWGSEYLKKKYVPPVARGEANAAHANTEPGAGSDVAAIQTRARRVNNHYVISGRKIYITGAGEADYLLVSARTEPPKPDKRWWGITTFVVEREWPGVRIGQQFKVIGLRGEQPYEVILDEVKVPEENVVGPVNEGFKVLMDTYDHARVTGVAARSIGMAQAVFEKALEYAIQRETFGQKIILHGMIAEKIADMYIKLQTARLLTYWAATLADKARPEFPLVSSMAKAYASEVAEWIARQAVQIHGGYGVDFETGIERYLRDAIIGTIVEGTSEIQRLIIVRQLLRLLNVKI